MDLVCQIRKDPESGARRLFAEHGARLRAFALRLCEDPAAADDLALRALSRAVERIGQFRGGDPHTWLCSILVRMRRSDLRRAGVRAERAAEPGELDALPDPGPDPLAALVARSDAEAVAAAVSRLPELYRAVVLLRYWEEFSRADTAAALGVPLGTAKFRLTRARALLRADLEPLFGKEHR